MTAKRLQYPIHLSRHAAFANRPPITDFVEGIKPQPPPHGPRDTELKTKIRNPLPNADARRQSDLLEVSGGDDEIRFLLPQPEPGRGVQERVDAVRPELAQ